MRAGTIHFEFRGKSGVEHEIDLQNPKTARIVKKCQDLPGQELFQYLDDEGNIRDIGSQDVNDYLREIAGDEFTAKDFRTWSGTVLAAEALDELGGFTSQKQANRNVVQAIQTVAGRLGNTRAVCRKCYIHPAILDSYLDGTLAATLARRPATPRPARLSPEEAAVLCVLERRLLRRRKAA